VIDIRRMDAINISRVVELFAELQSKIIIEVAVANFLDAAAEFFTLVNWVA
jgi:hypothetical protein